MKLAFVLLILSSVPVCACPQLKIENGWIRESPPTATTAAGYMTLYNAGNKPFTITNIRSADFANTMLHETTIKNGMAQMTMLDSLTLAPRQRIKLQPSGTHLMLMQSVRRLHAGDKVQIIFECGGESRSTSLLVKKDMP